MMLKLFSISLFLILSSAAFSQDAPGRERINFDAHWFFHKGAVDGSVIQCGLAVPSWRWKSAGKTLPTDLSPSDPSYKTDGGDWKDAANGQDLFNNAIGFAWVKALLPDIPGPQRVLHFSGVDDNCTVWVNGKKMIYHEGWNDPFDIPLDSIWNEKGPNEVTVLVENSGGPGGIKEADLLSASQTIAAPPVAGEDFNDKDWSKVHLPHDFVVEGTFDEKADCSHGFLPKDEGWYRKAFDLPASDKGKSLWIDFDGVYRDSRVWLNGVLLGAHSSGYTSFHYDISDKVHYGGRNVLTVHVDARDTEGWWYEGGGIYRHVWLIKADPLHVAPWGVFVVSTPNQETDPSEASIQVSTTLANQSGQSASFDLVSEVQDPDGKTVLSLPGHEYIGPGENRSVTQSGKVAQPKLWSMEDSALYHLVTRVVREGKTVDSVTTPFGIRTLRFDKDLGFFLNGKSVKLKGTCNHQDFAGVGIAIPDRIFTYRLEKLKEMGSNAYRCSHNPPAPELLDECDRLGILVMDENRRLGDSPEVLNQVESMVLRDRNHPSVILWSLCNEERLQGTPEGQKKGEVMKKLILSLDKTRLITCAMNEGVGSGLSNVVDLQGFNYHPDRYEPFHKEFPNKPMFGSETGSTVCTRGIYGNDTDKGYVSAYDENYTAWSQTAENGWKPIDVPYMAGCFVWTGFDYKGEPTPYNWPCINSHFGIVDMCGFPKDNFYYYQARWGDQPVLHILPHWTWPGKEGLDIDVWVHTNLDKVVLFLNDVSQGERILRPDGHLEWKVPYAPGTLKAVGYKDGKAAMVERVETTGKPASIRLTPYSDKLLADGEDATPVKVEILDAQGRVVPVAGNEVKFNVTGAGHIAGVGNGDPSSHEPDKASQRRAFNGLCMVVVGADETPGRILLTAKSNGLQSASVTLTSGAND